MMYCPRCGTPNADTAKFCAVCGAPLAPSEPEPVNQQPPQTYGAPQNNYTGQPYYGGADPNAYRPAAQAQSSTQTQVREGTFGAAWKDLTVSAGWFKQTILLGLLNAVPILNLSVTGYAMDWGREVAYERREAMPAHLFGHRTMLLGLCLGVFSLLMNLFMGIVSLVASTVIPILGVIASIVFCVFVTMFTSVGLIRMGIFGKFGAAFDLVADWRAFRKNLGTLFCASFLPSIIIGCIASVIVIIILSITFAAVGSNLYGMVNDYSYGYGYGLNFDITPYGLVPNVNEIVSVIQGYIAVFIIIGLICWYIIAYAQTLIALLTYRALGHWALRTVPEWREQAFDEQKIYGVDFPAEPMLEEICRNR